MRVGRVARCTGSVGVALAALVAVGGCGGSGDDGPGGGPGGPGPARAETFTKAQTEAALLTDQDLGYGWEVDHDNASPSPSGGSGGQSSKADTNPGSGRPRCDAYFTSWTGPKAGQEQATSSRNFSKPATNEHIGLEVDAYRSAAEARKTMSVARDLPAACDGANLDFNWGGPQKTDIKQVTVPKLDDESAGMRISGKLPTASGTELHIEILLVREGANITTVTFGGQTTADPSLMQSLLQKAADRLHAAAQDRIREGSVP